MTSPVRFPAGVTNRVKANPLGMMGQLDPTKYYTFFDDFDTWVTDTSGVAKYTITTTEGGSGDATEALADAANGVLVITNDGADNDCDWLQKIGENFLLASGKKLFFKARFKVSDATQSDWVMGLQVTDTTPLDTGGDGVSDAIFFQKDDGDTNIDFYMQKTTSAQVTNTAVTTAAADDTYMTLGFYFDGARYVDLYKDDVKVYTADFGATLATNLPDTELTVSFGIQNGAAAAKVLSVDYIFAAQER